MYKNDILKLKSQRRFRIEKHNVFTNEVSQILLTVNDDKRTQLFDSIKPYAFGTRKDLVCKKEETVCNNIVKQCKNDEL